MSRRYIGSTTWLLACNSIFTFSRILEMQICKQWNSSRFLLKIWKKNAITEGFHQLVDYFLRCIIMWFFFPYDSACCTVSCELNRILKWGSWPALRFVLPQASYYSTASAQCSASVVDSEEEHPILFMPLRSSGPLYTIPIKSFKNSRITPELNLQFLKKYSINWPNDRFVHYYHFFQQTAPWTLIEVDVFPSMLCQPFWQCCLAVDGM